MMATIEELAARVLAAGVAARRAHWKTGSFSAHMALGTFYTDAAEAVDSVVEVYQGSFDLIGDFSVESEAPASIVQYLRAEADWIEAGRDEIARESDTIGALIDDLAAVYRRAVYRLEKLL